VNPSPIRLIALSLAVVLALAACSDAPAAPTAAAVVNATDITDAQLQKEADLFRFLGAINQTPCGQPEQGESEESACNRFALTNLIQERLIETYAEANDISVTDQQISDIIKQLDDSLGAPAVDKALKAQTLTRDDLRVLAREVLLFQAAQQQVTEAQLGEDKLKQLYQEQLADFTTVQADHILVKTEAEAQDVYQQVTAPGATRDDFLALAKEVSIDPSAAQNSGSLGSAVASTYVPEFAAAVTALDPGEISQPVKTDFGWHVIRLEDEQVTPFAQAKQQLIQSQAIVVFNEWLRGQADEQGVDVNPTFGRWDNEQLQVVAVRSTDPSATESPVAETPVNETPTAAPATP
jgi:parvulin-like peptidyl-prolyl isomerase